jgi:diketogulonate reductase-like aldo/keto reductase
MHTVDVQGARIPAIGLGTWTLNSDQCADMVARAAEVGYRHFDTAAIYANERGVGEGMRLSGLDRTEMFVTTKVWWTDIGKGDLQRSAERSLGLLGLDYVDILLIHWPNPRIPLEESIAALNDVRQRKYAKHVGVSNFPTALLARAVELSDAPLVCDQVEYHPYLSQRRVKAFCDQNGMALVSYCPLFRGGPIFDENAVKDAAAAHGKTAAQIVLRWHVQQPGVVCIPRTTRRERLSENFKIFDFELSDIEMSAISDLARPNSRLCDYEFSPAWDSG